MNVRLFFAMCVVALAGCGKPQPEPPAPSVTSGTKQEVPQGAAKVAPAIPTGALKIKGLYIGMDIQTVPDALVDMLSQQRLDGFGFTDVIKYSSGEQCVLLYDKQFLRAIEARMHERYDAGRARAKIDDQLQASCYASDGVVVVKSGADGAVNRVEFNAVGDLFDAKNLQPSEFTKRVVNEYHIPAMKPNGEHSGWTYDSPDGTRLEIVVKKVFGAAVTRLYMSKAGA